MEDRKGFLELKTVKDYWAKLNNDYDELKEDNENTYKAFNFFVTAYHLVDWIFEGKYSDDRKELNKIPLVKISSHIANGIKHFETNDRHSAVEKIEQEGYFEEGYVEKGYVESPIIISLEEEYRDELGEKIKVVDLAEKLINFWNEELTNRGLI